MGITIFVIHGDKKKILFDNLSYNIVWLWKEGYNNESIYCVNTEMNTYINITQ